MHATPSGTRRGFVARLLSLILGLCLSLGLVLALAWVGAWTAEEAASGSGVDYAGRTAVTHVRATRAVTLKKPDGTKAGDVLVASFSVDHAPKVSAAPAGWTSLLPGRLRAGRSTSMFAYYRVVTAADSRTTSWSWRLSGRQTWSGGMARYKGVDTDHPLDTAVSVASSGSARSMIVVPGVRTTRNGAVLIGSLGATGGRFTMTPPAGWDEAWDVTRGKASEHAHSPQQDSGATGELTWTVSSARPLAAWVATLRPEKQTRPTPTTPQGLAPTASFTVAPSTGTAPFSVAFTDTSTGSPSSWSWDFGDGTTATVRNPSHTYAAAGSYTVSLRATNAAGSNTVTSPAAVTVAAPHHPVLVGAGDIASCAYAEDSATAALVNATAGTVFALGDNAYPHGTAADYASCYHPTWGAAKDRTRPVVGNHEYLTSSSAAPYFDYFGAAAGEAGKGWYSYDLGTHWHVVVLNSNCTYVGGCEAGSPQEQWLRADLAASTRRCTVAMWHHPRFSSGEHGNDSTIAAFWDALYADGAELVLNGHDHGYERFAPQNPSGAHDPAHGIREFVVGTGGQDFRSFGSAAANSEVRSVAAHGVLKLTLNSGSYDWSFLPIAGKTFNESGTDACHGAPS